jgi:lipoprotein LpqH
VVKRGIVVGVTAASIVVAGCAGCSKKSDTGTSGESGTPAPIALALTVDGQPQNVSGPVTCTPAGDNINIGIGDAANGVGAVVSNGDPPIVHAVGLGNINGVTFGYSDAAPGQDAAAGAQKKDKSYAIKGTATGVDSNQQPVSKSFEMTVACP